MYTFCLLWRSLALLFLVMTTASSQALDTNPTLYENADGWTLSSLSEWDTFGYDRGSIHLQSTSSQSRATQCVAAEGGQTFVATARVYGSCPGARLYALWADTADCSDTDRFPGNGIESTLSDEWEPLTVLVPARDDAYMIELVLLNLGGCTSGYYFDDVMLQFDDIFNDGFDFRGID